MIEQQRVYQLLHKYDLRAKKKFGQNFLISDHVLHEIVQQAHITKDTIVIEIGPGLGSLTKRLIEASKYTIAYEIDSEMISILHEEFKHVSNLFIQNMDILKANIKADIINLTNETNNIKVVANLPYYITSPILFRILKEKDLFQSITIMMQKEVANRINATPRSKDFGYLSVMMQTYAEIKKVIDVGRSCFYPIPSVDSVVLQLTPYKVPKYKITNEEAYDRFVQGIFLQKRKTLLNNLSHMISKSKEDVITLLEQVNLTPNTRAEELSVTQIVTLYELFNQK